MKPAAAPHPLPDSPARTGAGLTVAKVFYAVLLLAVFGAAAIQRFRLPQTPLFDPDFKGYLRPALSVLTGHGFAHYRRDSLYPGFVLAVLKLFGDFRAIGIVQHLLGLAAGGWLLLAYERSLRLLRQSGSGPPGLILSLLGLLLVATYLSAPSAILLEQRIRPEGVFPFFALLSVYLNLGFIQRRWIVPSAAAAAWLGAAQMIVSLTVYKLKPSFGLALLCANLPMVASWLTGGVSARSKILMTAGGGTFCALFLLWPESVLKRTDPEASTFLPDTLLTIHADQMRDQIAEDLSADRPSPFPRQTVQALLDRLNATLTASRLPQNRPYPSLGFNPDYLLYTDSVFAGIMGGKHGSSPQRVKLGYYYYERTFWHHPGRMLAKIWCQLQTFYHFGTPDRSPLFGLSGTRSLELPAGFRQNVALYQQPGGQRGFDEYPPARAFMARSQTLAQQPLALEQNPLLSFVQRMLGLLYLPGTLATLLIAGCVAATGRLRAGWLAPVAVTLLVLSYNFGNNLTIAVVHSLDVGRYIDNQLGFTLLASSCNLLLLGETIRRLTLGWQSTKMRTAA